MAAPGRLALARFRYRAIGAALSDTPTCCARMAARTASLGSAAMTSSSSSSPSSSSSSYATTSASSSSSSSSSSPSSSSSSFAPGIILTTTESMQEAKALAGQLVKAKLAACVQMKGVVSAYMWDGVYNESPEVQLTIKCDLSRFGELEAFIKANHPYDTPQIVGTPITHGSAEYLNWLRANTTAAAASALASAVVATTHGSEAAAGNAGVSAAAAAAETTIAVDGGVAKGP